MYLADRIIKSITKPRDWLSWSRREGYGDPNTADRKYLSYWKCLNLGDAYGDFILLMFLKQILWNFLYLLEWILLENIPKYKLDLYIQIYSLCWLLKNIK